MKGRKTQQAADFTESHSLKSHCFDQKTEMPKENFQLNFQNGAILFIIHPAVQMD